MESYSDNNFIQYLVGFKLVLGVEINLLHLLPHWIIKTSIFAMCHFCLHFTDKETGC